MRTHMRDSLAASTEQSGSGVFGALLIASKFVNHFFTEWRFWTEILEARLRLGSTTCQVNLAA